MSLISTIAREGRFVSRMVSTLREVRAATSDPDRTIADEIEATVDAHPERDAFVFRGETWSYAEFDAHANRFSHWARAQGFSRGDTVALYMKNRPEFVAAWYGLAKVGVITALLNNQITGQGLAHCLKVADARAVIVERDLIEAVESAQPLLDAPLPVWSLGGAEAGGVEDLDAALAAASDTRPDLALRADVKLEDTALKLFTSGTTGMPKAARMTSYRVLSFMHAFRAAPNVQPSDRILIALPLYHGTGGLCAVGSALACGAAVVLERRFSVSRFWETAAREKATMFFYVGELCRFLSVAKPSPYERAHTIRAAVGNGLRPDVWERFRDRFGVEQIYEFYGSTEGNVSLMNIDGKVGAVGRIPFYARKMFNLRLVKFDIEAEEPVRGPDGLCIEADEGEAGEALGEIRGALRYRFDGYSGNEEETSKKILRNVFVQGDAWFRTGDLLRRDDEGYVYFVDRIGDTFRWKSENVATSEVAEALGAFDGVAQANVYGVQVPGYEGRAGMAALVARPDISLNALHAFLEGQLPGYARPVFLRLQNEAGEHATGTFKLKKLELAREGFDPSTVPDPLYFDDPASGRYVALDQSVYDEIKAGRVRL